MNAAKGFKDEESGILDEVLQTSDQKEVVHKNLTGTKTQSGEHPSGFIHTRNKQKTECSTNEQFLVPLCQIQGLLFSKEITTFLPRKITTLTLQC